MHDNQEGINRKLQQLDDLSLSLQDKKSPHSFKKNLLTIEQLNELVDMSEIKKMVKARKRS